MCVRYEIIVISLGYRPRKSIVKVKSNNLDEQKPYGFAAARGVIADLFISGGGVRRL